MGMGMYVLDGGGHPVPADNPLEWGKFMQDGDGRTVSVATFTDCRVSTVFLGLDHAFGDGPPVLWETMIFGGEHDGYQRRYTTREAALDGHLAAMALVTNGEDDE